MFSLPEWFVFDDKYSQSIANNWKVARSTRAWGINTSIFLDFFRGAPFHFLSRVSEARLTLTSASSGYSYGAFGHLFVRDISQDVWIKWHLELGPSQWYGNMADERDMLYIIKVVLMHLLKLLSWKGQEWPWSPCALLSRRKSRCRGAYTSYIQLLCCSSLELLISVHFRASPHVTGKAVVALGTSVWRSNRLKSKSGLQTFFTVASHNQKWHLGMKFICT